MSKKNTKKKDKRSYQQKNAGNKARQEALNKGKSLKTADKKTKNAEKVTTHTKPQNLKEKMQQDRAKSSAAKTQAKKQAETQAKTQVSVAKKEAPKQSYQHHN